MTKLKKLLALLLALAMVFSLMTVLTACDSEGEDYSDEDDKDKDEDDGDGETPELPPVENINPSPVVGVVQQVSQVFYEGKSMTATLSNIVHYEDKEVFRFSLENHTSHQVTAEFANIVINGYKFRLTTSTSFFDETVEFLIEIPRQQLNLCGITDIYTMSFTFSHGDVSGSIPEDIQLTIAEGTQEYDVPGYVLADSDGLRLILKPESTFEDGIYTMYIYAENMSERNLYLNTEDWSFNRCGSSCASGFSGSLQSGVRQVFEVTVDWLGNIGIEGTDDIQNMQALLYADDLATNERVIDESIYAIFKDGNFMYYPEDTQEIYQGDNIVLKLDKIVDHEAGVSFYLFADLWANHPDTFEVSIIEINGEACQLNGWTVYTKTGITSFLNITLLNAMNPAPVPADEVETITFSIKAFGDQIFTRTFTITVE